MYKGLVVYGLPNVNDPEVVAAGRGYDHAKWVAEKLLELASHETPIRPVIFRVGQVVGGSNGFWESAEWLPSILKCLPSSEQVSLLLLLTGTLANFRLSASHGSLSPSCLLLSSRCGTRMF